MQATTDFIRKNFQPSPSDDANGKGESEAFGQVTFYGQPLLDNLFKAKYLRFSPQELQSKQAVVDLLFKYWKIPHPRLIISITGGIRHFVMQNDMLSKFNRSLLRAATTADALIITNGIWKGATRLIGEAAQSNRDVQGATKNRVTLLGIACWGIVKDSECLINAKGVAIPARKRYKVYENEENKDVPASLDPNHNAFLLLDDGEAKNKFGQEIPFRNELEKDISQYLEATTSEKTPHVLLVIEGREPSLEAAISFAREGWPSVVVNGMGGAADLIAYAYRSTEAVINECDRARFEKIMASWPFWRRYLQLRKDEDPAQVAQARIQEANQLLYELCIIKRHLVSVVELSAADNLDGAVLEANFKAATRNADPMELLELAIQWDGMKIAEPYVFTIENICNPGFFERLNSEHDCFLAAVKRNYHESVSVLIEHGFDICGNFVTPLTIGSLYREVLSPDGKETKSVDKFLRAILNDLASENIQTCPLEQIPYVIGVLIDDLIPGDFPNIYDSDGYQNEAMARNRGKRMGTSLSDLSQVDALMVPFPYRDIFVYAVLLNRKELAIIMWQRFQNGGALAAAVFAAAVLHGMSNESVVKAELAQELKEHAKFWEKTAAGFIEYCYQRDPAQAHRMLIRAVPEFGNKTPFETGNHAALLTFMSSSCCYTKLNINWRGHISVKTPMMSIVATTFLPMLIPLITFSGTSYDREVENKASRVGDAGDEEILEGVASYEEGTTASSSRSVSCFVSPTRIQFFRSLYLFYSAPVTKYVANAISQGIYLFLFAIFLLTDHYNIGRVTDLALVVWVWTGVLMLEELRQILLRPGNLRLKFRAFWDSWWYRMDVAAYILFIAATICHLVGIHAQHQEEGYEYTEKHDHQADSYLVRSLETAALDLYNLSVMFLVLRLMRLLYISNVLGPKVIAVFEMLKNLGFFLVIYLVMMIAFSVPLQSLLYPGASLSWELLEAVIYNYVLILLGMGAAPEPAARYRTDQLKCTAFNASDPDTFDHNLKLSERCPRKNYLAIPFVFAYKIAIVIVLMNILIAMFWYSYSQVTDKSEQVWRFNLYEFALHYYNKSALPAPICFLELIGEVLAYLAGKCKPAKKRKRKARENSPFVLCDDAVKKGIDPDTNLTPKQRKEVHDMCLLVRFESSSIHTFFGKYMAEEEK